MSDQTFLIPGQQIKPQVDQQLAKNLAASIYGLQVTRIAALNGYDDLNYHITCEAECSNPHIPQVTDDGYVLKIVNALDSRNSDLMEAQTDMLLFLQRRGIECPVPVRQKNGSYFSLETLSDADQDSRKVDTEKQSHVVRLLEFKPGVLLSKVPLSEELMVKVGRFTVKLDQVLAGFSHPAYEAHARIWNLKEVPKLEEFVWAIDDPTDRHLISEVVDDFKRVVAVSDRLEQGMIHGDLNEQNIIVDPNGEDVKAIIDFNDAHRGCLLFELAIVLCYMMILGEDVGVGRFLMKGYQEQRLLPDLEKKLLRLCICSRLCQTLTMGVYSYKVDPGNEYVLGTQKSGWKMLRKLWPMSDEEFFEILGL